MLAHSTHVRGSGVMAGGVEKAECPGDAGEQDLARQTAPGSTWATWIPAAINLADWQNREDEGILYVPRAGEMLYRVRSAA